MLKIEQARKAIGLRAKLDRIDVELSAFVAKEGLKLNLLVKTGDSSSSWLAWALTAEETAAVMEARHNRLKRDRLLILAEAAELGLAIEDEPAPQIETPAEEQAS